MCDASCEGRFEAFLLPPAMTTNNRYNNGKIYHVNAKCNGQTDAPPTLCAVREQCTA